VNVLPLGRVPAIALANAILLTISSTAQADETEASTSPPNVLLSSTLPLSSPLSSPLEEDRFAPSFGIRKGRGFQVVKPIEYNDRAYEIKLSGPIFKSGSRKKNFGLNFELRF
jgi:hypothetical protein